VLDEIKTTKRKRGIHTRFRSFSEARALVHDLRLPNSVEYHRWARGSNRLEDIPVNPNLAYRDSGWQGWADWLGPSYRLFKRPFVSYEDARTFVHALNFPTKEAFDKWIASGARAGHIPACPSLTYKKSGWRDWQDFLGYGGRKRGHGRNHFLPFQEARAWVHAQNFNSTGDWHRLRAQKLLPDNIPTAPNDVYHQSGWVSWQDWVGCPSPKERWRSFKEAREFARSLSFKDAPTYRKWAMTPERPVDVPAAPHSVYRNRGWVDWYDWLGHPRIGPRQYLPFDEARDFMHEQKLAGFSGWAEWCRSGLRPNNIPSDPRSIYRHRGWQNWPDFLGSAGRCRRGRRRAGCPGLRPLSRKWRTFEDARNYVRALGLTSLEHWKHWAGSSEKPHDIPKTPSYAYRDLGWTGMADWLGLERRQAGRPRGSHASPQAEDQQLSLENLF